MEAQDNQENNGSCEKGPSSRNFKLKLKISKLKKDEDESRGDEDVTNVREEKNLFTKQKKDHICCECGKEFRSGKALGGHISRAHVQANRRVFDEIICEICFKSFPSKNSLFGHMRCHPNRDWKGVKPPSKQIAKNGGFRANFHDEDEDRFASIRNEEEERSIHVNVVAPPLKGWDVKDRRGRSPLAKKRSFSFIESDDYKDLRDAVQQLIRLVNGDDNNNNNKNNSSEVMMCSSNLVGSAPKEAPFRDLKDKSNRKVVVDEENCEETCLAQVHKKRKREKELIKLEPGKDLVTILVIKKSPEVK